MTLFLLDNMGRMRRKLGSRNYKNYTEEQVEAAVRAIRAGMSSRAAEEMFKIPRKTLLNKKNNVHGQNVGHPTALSLVEERHLVDVVIACAEYGAPLTQIELRMAVRDYLNKKGVEHNIFKDNLPGKSWAEEFVLRYKHRLTKRQCQNLKRSRAETSEDDLKIYFDNLKKSLDGVDPKWIVNYDETNLSDNPGTSKCIFARGTKYPERCINSTKTAISIMFSATASGDTLPLYVVYKSERLYDRWVAGGPPGTLYNRSQSGWFDASTFQDWFMKVIVPWARRTNSPKVVIGDNLSSHINIDVLRECQRHNIRFVLLPPNTTQVTQPLDVSYFRPLKQAWRSILTKVKLENPNLNCVDKCVFPQLLSELVKKMKFNSPQNIKNGFKATGIYPYNPDEVYKKMPNARFKARVEGDIDNALLDFLKEQRNPKKSQLIQRGKKKMLNIRPGCSISAEDISPAGVAPASSLISEVVIPTTSAEVITDVSDTESIPDADAALLNQVIEDEENEREKRQEHQGEAVVSESEGIKQGMYVVVQFNTKKTCRHFVGIILENEDEDQNLTVKFCKKNEQGFVFPERDDISLVNFFDIKTVLPNPVIGRRGVFTFNTDLSAYNL